ncbi:HTH-type transcriptional regulator CysL [bacterium YEK0313]|nr:HTH-type transcriptional regulator CysL [bacterium YEK0313]
MRFDLTDLRLFSLVVEAGSITLGAARAHMALPSASARLRGMEETIGIPLLVRGRRGVTPTPAGDALAHHARIVLRQMEELRGELGDYAKGLKAEVHLAANTAAMTEFLPAALAPFLKRRPHVDIDLKERQSTEIVKAVAGGLAEIGIISDAVDPGPLELFPFAVDRLVLVTAKGHPLAGEARIAFHAVLGHAFVGLSGGSALQDHIGEHAARAGRALAFRIRMRTFEGICRMVAEDVGLAIVPEAAALRCRRTMPIQIVRLTDGWAARQLKLCVHARGGLPAPARELLDHLIAFGS